MLLPTAQQEQMHAGMLFLMPMLCTASPHCKRVMAEWHHIDLSQEGAWLAQQWHSSGSRHRQTGTTGAEQVEPATASMAST